jgi:hypothetical protein
MNEFCLLRAKTKPWSKGVEMELMHRTGDLTWKHIEWKGRRRH